MTESTTRFNWGDAVAEAQRIVEDKPTFPRFIAGTPLANDIAVWMADFAWAVHEAAAEDARAYLARLLTSIHPTCVPLPDLYGLCTQIDNMTTEIPRLRAAVSDAVTAFQTKAANPRSDGAAAAHLDSVVNRLLARRLLAALEGQS